MKQSTSPRRTDRANENVSAPDNLIRDIPVRNPIAGASPLATSINTLVREGDLYEKLPDKRVHCFACAHDCKINDGGRGICQVRYNVGGTLFVPHNYVAALQCDLVEKKPFFHVLPSSDALTFGMLGCDLHCAYCFTGDTMVVTNQGPLNIEQVFQQGARFETKPDAEISYPDDLSAVTKSGSYQPIQAAFKHHYRGEMQVLHPFYLPALHCTPDHRLYATDDPQRAPELICASQLTTKHYLAIPHQIEQPNSSPADAFQLLSKFQTISQSDLKMLTCCLITTENFYLVPLRDITSEKYDGDVYNLQVENEHNYLANFFAVSNCQNWDISQALRDTTAGRPPSLVTPAQLVEIGRQQNARIFASSYNEPLITSEWAVEIFQQATAAGFLCAYVSNGNATRQVLEYIKPYVRAYKVDLKSMRDQNYRQLGAPLQHILDGIKMVYEMGFWLEIVTLIIPGFNDSDAELRDAAQFLASLSPNIPWHVTAFHQDYKMMDKDNTTIRDLLRACEIGREAGLNFVYAGNLPGRVGTWENTYCPNCHTLLIERYGYLISAYHLTPQGTCPTCSTVIPGIWHTNPNDVRLGDPQTWQSRRPRAV